MGRRACRRRGAARDRASRRRPPPRHRHRLRDLLPVGTPSPPRARRAAARRGRTRDGAVPTDRVHSGAHRRSRRGSPPRGQARVLPGVRPGNGSDRARGPRRGHHTHSSTHGHLRSLDPVARAPSVDARSRRRSGGARPAGPDRRSFGVAHFATARSAAALSVVACVVAPGARCASGMREMDLGFTNVNGLPGDAEPRVAEEAAAQGSPPASLPRQRSSSRAPDRDGKRDGLVKLEDAVERSLGVAGGARPCGRSRRSLAGRRRRGERERRPPRGHPRARAARRQCHRRVPGACRKRCPAPRPGGSRRHSVAYGGQTALRGRDAHSPSAIWNGSRSRDLPSTSCSSCCSCGRWSRRSSCLRPVCWPSEQRSGSPTYLFQGLLGYGEITYYVPFAAAYFSSRSDPTTTSTSSGRCGTRIAPAAARGDRNRRTARESHDQCRRARARVQLRACWPSSRCEPSGSSPSRCVSAFSSTRSLCARSSSPRSSRSSGTQAGGRAAAGSGAARGTFRRPVRRASQIREPAPAPRRHVRGRARGSARRAGTTRRCRAARGASRRAAARVPPPLAHQRRGRRARPRGRARGEGRRRSRERRNECGDYPGGQRVRPHPGDRGRAQPLRRGRVRRGHGPGARSRMARGRSLRR